MKNRFENKYISILSDSISTLEGYLPPNYPSFYSYRYAHLTGIFLKRDTWWGRVLDHFGAKLLVNNSWSGSYVCRDPRCEIESYGCSDARTSGLDINGILPDHIIVFIGTNDRGRGFRLVSDDRSDLSVLENAYRVMLQKLKKNYPAAEIWCCTFPITSCSREPSYEFFEYWYDIRPEDYCDLVKNAAAEQGCHVIDLFDRENLCDTVEGLHPNYAGMETLSKMIIKAMEKESE